MARNSPEILDLDAQELEPLLQRLESGTLDTEDYPTICALIKAYMYLLDKLEDKNTTLARLRKILFGSSSEKTQAVIGKPDEAPSGDAAQDHPSGDGVEDNPSASSGQPEGESKTPDEGDPVKQKKPGHGRNGADAYTGAQKVQVPHESLKAGDPCPEPECAGTVYGSAPSVIVRISGRAPLDAKVYELQRLRCNLCGKVYTAQAPEDAATEKYDQTAAAMIGVLKYGSGLPFHRIDRLQNNLGIPVPASTQWNVVSAASQTLVVAYKELARQAAQGHLMHSDDTWVKILEHMGERARKRALDEDFVEDTFNKDGSPRTGLYTSGLVVTSSGQQIALFFTGRHHAGENVMKLLEQRAEQLGRPILMCDALSRNVPGELAAIIANCLAHARRNFVDLHDRFPAECRYVLEALKMVYKNDAEACKAQMSPEQRLAFHQAQSGPVMEELHKWLKKQFDDHLVEPNSGLGQAISYMLKHWDKLTLFLRKAGAPLDNNVCERALKKAILHRKNSLFYKTDNGALVGDIFMTLIYTCEFCGADPHDYICQLLRHPAELAASPADWLPWNYQQALESAKPAA
jgi:hypothetical protein